MFSSMVSCGLGRKTLLRECSLMRTAYSVHQPGRGKCDECKSSEHLDSRAPAPADGPVARTAGSVLGITALPTKDIGQVGGGKDKRTFRRWWKSQDRVDHIAYIGAANNLAAVIVFVREGLGSATRLGARGTQRLISRDSLSNQSVSRTRWPPSEKIPSGVCDLPPVRVRPVPSPAAL